MMKIKTAVLLFTVLGLLGIGVHLSLVNRAYEGREEMSSDVEERSNVTRILPDPDTANPKLILLRKYGKVSELPTKSQMANMSDMALEYMYHSFLDNIDILCKRKLRMGNIGDGGWEICDNAPYRPIKPCVIYSFGINNDFSFDDDVTKVYECKVFSFDPSMNKKSFQRTPLNYFFNIGIGATNGLVKKWEMRTLSGIRKMLNHTQTVIDVIKMDIEDGEWPSLPQMARNGDFKTVRQLLVEYHHPADDDTAKSLLPRLMVIKDIEDAGFRKFYVHKNPNCGYKSKNALVFRAWCYEIHYINTHLLV